MHVCALVSTHTHACMHAHMNTLTHARTHAHTHTHTHTHTKCTQWYDCQSAETSKFLNLKKGSPNAQMIHICHTYRTSVQSSPFHTQPLWMFGLFHATLQQYYCTNSTFLITCDLEWRSNSVTGIKMYSLVTSINILCLVHKHLNKTISNIFSLQSSE